MDNPAFIQQYSKGGRYPILLSQLVVEELAHIDKEISSVLVDMTLLTDNIRVLNESRELCLDIAKMEQQGLPISEFTRDRFKETTRRRIASRRTAKTKKIKDDKNRVLLASLQKAKLNVSYIQPIQHLLPPPIIPPPIPPPIKHLSSLS